jgi:RNA-binding protein Tab2/Atab2
MTATIWELDFFSRPVLDQNNKKIWELLICNSDRTWEYVQNCPGDQVNSEWLAEQLKAILETRTAPIKVRFFRPSMTNIVIRGCKLAGLVAQPSRRLFTMSQWLQQRMDQVYAQQPGFVATNPLPLKLLPVPIPKPIPDALMGEKWAIASLAVAEFKEATEWQIDFGELFDLNLNLNLSEDIQIPGVIIYSVRATPLAAWMSGVDPVFLGFEQSSQAQLILDAGAETRWSLASTANSKVVSDAKKFELDKIKSAGVHFLAIQANPETENFAGFWLLQTV